MGLLDRLIQKRPPPAEVDKISIKQLRKLGADLSRPRHVLHFVYFDDEQSASSAAEAIAEGGYTTEVEPPSDTVDQWLVRSESMRVVDDSTVPVYRHWFEEIAASHGGEYDGWEAAKKP
jgi:hypothetical protein